MDGARLVSLMEGDELRDRLGRLLPRDAGNCVSVGITIGGRHRTATTPADTSASSSTALPLGCITKLMTAALLRHSIANGLLSLETRLHSHLAECRLGTAGDGITLEHLLNHTHGLDDSSIPYLLFRQDGYIDHESLCAALFGAPRLAAPGRYYSYGNAGAWLGAAVLEAVHDQRYVDVLESMLLAPLGIAVRFAPEVTARPNLCPAVGGALEFTSEDVLKFLDYQMTSTTFGFTREPSELLAELAPLPGWHSTEHGLYLGWKYYGNGWFGHNADLPAGSGMFVRINPSKRIGVLVSSSRHQPTWIARALFREHLPELVTLQVPRLRPGKPLDSIEPSRFVGEYENRSMHVAIRRTESSDLRVRIKRKGAADAGDEQLIPLLGPAGDNVFFLKKTAEWQPSYVQFIAVNDRGAEFLWNGTQVLPRTTAAR